MENRRRMRVLLDTKAEKFDLTIVSFDSNFDKTDLVRKTQFEIFKMVIPQFIPPKHLYKLS
jgi:hypothetical protein